MSGEPETGRMLALAERAERLGYHSIWVGDSITSRPRHEPLTMLTAIAMRTTKATLGTAVLLPALRQPVAMAHQVATLDRLAEGRLVLGVGTGGDSPSNRAEFAALGVDFERRLGRMNEHLALCRKLWSGEPVDHHGEFYTVENASIGPSTHTPGGPPLWVTGSSAPGHRRAGTRYDGWMPIGPIDSFVAGLPVVQEAARSVGRDPSEVTIVDVPHDLARRRSGRRRPDPQRLPRRLLPGAARGDAQVPGLLRRAPGRAHRVGGRVHHRRRRAPHPPLRREPRHPPRSLQAPSAASWPDSDAGAAARSRQVDACGVLRVGRPACPTGQAPGSVTWPANRMAPLSTWGG